MKSGMRFAVGLLAAGTLAFAGASIAGDKGHGGMSGGMGQGSMQAMPGDAKMEGHGMMMGDRIFEGKVGSFHGEASLMDMRAQMANAKASGMKMEMKNTHHLSLRLTDPKTKKAITEGRGSVTVTGPGMNGARTDFMVIGGHFGADIALPSPGKYTFQVEVDAGGMKATTVFHHTVP